MQQLFASVGNASLVRDYRRVVPCFMQYGAFRPLHVNRLWATLQMRIDALRPYRQRLPSHSARTNQPPAAAKAARQPTHETAPPGSL